MAFAGSSTGFGAFGQQSAAKPLFGQPATSSPFGSQPTQQQGAPAFGAPAQQQQSTPAFGGGSIFGQPQQQQQQQQQNQNQPAGGLFGQPAQQQNQQSGGLFGQPAQQQQHQQPQQQVGAFGSSLFGGTNAQQQSTQPTSSLFSNPAPTTQPSNSLFGGTNQQTNSFFGNNTNQPSQPSIFGASTTNVNPFGGGFGQSTAQQPSLFGQRPAQPMSTSTSQQTPLFSKSTKFNDLPDEMKKVFENIDSHIQGRIQISKDLHQQKLGEESLKGQELIRSVHKELSSTSSVIHSDYLFTADIRAKVEQAVQDTITATHIVEDFKNPQQNGMYLKNHASFPLEYFARITEQMRYRLQWYKTTIEQIERKLSSSAHHTQSPQAISATLQAQHSTFIALASKTAALDAELQRIKTIYTQLWRARTGSMRDPFNDMDRATGGDFGISSLQV